MKVNACKSCGCSVEYNFIEEETGTKTSLPITKCPLCGGPLEDDDSENYEIVHEDNPAMIEMQE